jgi:hypothetical protein
MTLRYMLCLIRWLELLYVILLLEMLCLIVSVGVMYFTGTRLWRLKWVFQTKELDRYIKYYKFQWEQAMIHFVLQIQQTHKLVQILSDAAKTIKDV